MSFLIKSLRLASDPTRLRMLVLLESQELTVAELQDILAKGQSQISTHLAQLRRAGLVEDRRTGKNIFYRLKEGRSSDAAAITELMELLRKVVSEIPESKHDQNALKLILKKRRDTMRSYFDNLAGRLGREYLPGRSWKGLAEALISLLPPMVIADLGAGDGNVSQLLSQRAKQVIAIDNSEKMIAFGSDLARRHGLKNVEYRAGDMEQVPIASGEVDVAFFSQSLHHAQNPAKAIGEAWRILRSGGRIVILDLVRHQFEEARELYADVWLGFTELEMQQFLRDAGFKAIRTAVVHRESNAPHFETLLASADKPVR